MKFEEVLIKLDNSSCQTRNVTDKVLNAIKQNVESEYKELGLDVTVNKISNAEVFVKNFYNIAGYNVIKGGNRGYNSSNIIDNDFTPQIHDIMHIEMSLKRYCTEKGYKPNFYEIDDDNNKKGRYHFGFREAGVPDYFVYKCNNEGSIIEAFFVEVKSRDDSLGYNQFMWFLKYSLIPVRIFWIGDDDHE